MSSAAEEVRDKRWIALLLGGRMADLLGRRRLFLVGLVLFAVAPLAGGLASDDGQLIAARAVQGLGAALLSPAALSLLTVIFKEGRERNMAMGVWGAVAGSGGVAGVLFGGMLTEWAGWSGCCSSTCRSASSPRRSRCPCCPRAASPPPVTSTSPAP